METYTSFSINRYCNVSLLPGVVTNYFHRKAERKGKCKRQPDIFFYNSINQHDQAKKTGHHSQGIFLRKIFAEPGQIEGKQFLHKGQR